METLVVVAHHRNQYFSRCKNHVDIGDDFNCRNFQSGVGLLPTPLKPCATPTPVTKRGVSPPPEKHTNYLKRSVRSNSVPIPLKTDDFSYSELWAGPAYSNSPPPSSLPIPKFSLKPKRTVSLDLPGSVSEIDLHPIAKSAPASPTRERKANTDPREIFRSADSATKTLRRILNLDMEDE